MSIVELIRQFYTVYLYITDSELCGISSNMGIKLAEFISMYKRKSDMVSNI